MSKKFAKTILYCSFAFIAINKVAYAEPYGIDTRVPNASLLINDLPADQPGAMQIVRVFPNLSFTNPVLLVEVPDDSNRLCVVQQNGRIRIFQKSENPTSGDVSTFLDISSRVLNSGEQGMLGLAFDPNYSTNGKFYVYYSWNGTNPGTSRISRFTHYIDVNSTPDPGLNYKIPVDNLFYTGGPAGTATRKEIYAYGLRNPWRFSFDSQNGYLIAGDVGQGAREEIDAIISGGNFGWNIMEGTICYPPGSSCDQTGLILPLTDYDRSEGNSVTGGYVYYGSEAPNLYGRYIYGDFGSGRIWGLGYAGSTVDGPYVVVSSSGLNISGFGRDTSGEVYVLDYFGGGIYVLRQTAGGGDFPTRLSDIPVLLAAGSGTDQTNLGIIPYEPSATLWSDGALKERFMALPDLTQAGYRQSGGWDFPEKTILIKNFLMPMDERNSQSTAKRIETRLLYRKNGQWYGFSYEWDSGESDAQLLLTSKTKTFNIINESGETVTIDYLYPSRNQCIQCHTNAANGVLGLTTAQLNFDYLYPASGIADNQLSTLDHIDFFTDPLPNDPVFLPKMPDTSDTSASLQKRARAYLASNCSMCHQPGGTAPSNIDLRWEVVNSQMNAINVPPGNGDLGISGALIFLFYPVPYFFTKTTMYTRMTAPKVATIKDPMNP